MIIKRNCKELNIRILLISLMHLKLRKKKLFNIAKNYLKIVRTLKALIVIEVKINHQITIENLPLLTLHPLLVNKEHMLQKRYHPKEIAKL